MIADGFESLAGGLLPFLLYFAAGTALTVGFVALYAEITPHEELKLIRANNTGAAVSFGGALLGFGIPMAYLISQSVGVVEFLFWGIAAGLVQLLAFFAFRLVFPKISARIEGGEVAAPTVLAAMHVTVGMLNAASLTY